MRYDYLEDTFFSLPKDIETFAHKITKDLPEGYSIRPYTGNRSLSLYYKDDYVLCLTYELIQDVDYEVSKNFILRRINET